MIYSLVQSLTTPSGQVSSGTVQFTGAANLEVDETFPQGNDQGLVMTLDVSQVKAFWIQSDQNCTIETNSSGAPTNTLSLLANKPYVWYEGAYDAFKLTADVTQLFVTVPGATSANIKIRALYDPTI